MYADKITPSMAAAIDETNRRRAKQVAYNNAHGIDPQPLRKKIADITDMLPRGRGHRGAQARAGAGRRQGAGQGAGRAAAGGRGRRAPSPDGLPAPTWPSSSRS